MARRATTKNGTNGHKKRVPGVTKPTPAQQRARGEYVRASGHKVSNERAEKIRSQWQG